MTAVSALVNKAKSKVAPAITRSKNRSIVKAKSNVKGKLVQFPLARVGKTKVRTLTQKMRDDLVLNNRDKAKKLARSMLRKWRSRLELDEVDSVVDLSLCEAAMRFDPKRGASFITFLFYHLRGNLIRLVSDAANQNTLPLFDRELLDGAFDASQSNPIANAIEIAAALTGQEQVLPDEHFYKKEVAGLSRKACEKLDLLEQEVICRVFMNEEHLFDVAENLGYSRCHISRVKRKALDTLQTELKPMLVEPAKEHNVRISGRRRLISRRGFERREILNNVVTRKGRTERVENYKVAV